MYNNLGSPNFKELNYMETKKMEKRTVDELRPGQVGIVKKYHGKGNLSRHLKEMGLVNGTEIKLERKAPLGYPLEVKLQGFSLALRKEEAQLIEIAD